MCLPWCEHTLSMPLKQRGQGIGKALTWSALAPCQAPVCKCDTLPHPGMTHNMRLVSSANAPLMPKQMVDEALTSNSLAPCQTAACKFGNLPPPPGKTPNLDQATSLKRHGIDNKFAIRNSSNLGQLRPNLASIRMGKVWAEFDRWGGGIG